MKILINRKKVLKFILYFAIAFIICILVTITYIASRTELETTEMKQLASSKANKVSSVLTDLLYKTHILAAFVHQSNGEIENFEKIASIVMDNPAIKNVIIAPNGIVEYIYPLAGNEGALGLDYFSENEGNKEAILARDTGKLVLGGPFNLIQGGQALVGRLPIYIYNGDESEFWGIASVTLNYPQALDQAELEQLQNQGFIYEIWRISPDTDEYQAIAHSDFRYNKNSRFVEYPMNILNANWFFRLAPIRNWYEFHETWLFLWIGALISSLIAFLILHNYDLKSVKKELEIIALNDTLTGINNRRGGFLQVEELIRAKQSFILGYIDLDRFKYINDKYGHNSGDMALNHFTDSVSRQLNQREHVFARIGGDEFIIVFKQVSDADFAKTFLDNIKQNLAKDCLNFHGEKIILSYSVGYAIYPQDGASIDELISTADAKMYEAKSKKL